MNPAAQSIRNRALVNALVIVIFAVGVHALITMPRELNPRVSFNWAFILTFYPGASPEEVERLITIPIEDEVVSVKDIDVIISQSEPGKSFVWVKFEQIADADFQRRLEDVRAQVARVVLPDDVDDTDVREFDSYDFQPVVSVAISGDVGDRVLHDIASEIEEDLRNIGGLGRIESFGERKRAILVETDPHKLVANRLDIVDVEDALRRADSNLPAGVLKLGDRQLLLRTQAKISGVADVATITLRAGGEGRRLTVGDVAEITDGFEEQEIISRFNGKPAVSIALTKNERGNTIEIVSETRALLDSWRDRVPAGVSLDLYNDESLVIADILSVLQSNAVLGLILVVVGLVLFIGWRAALCAALGIPVTFLLAITALNWTDQSLNGSTLFGLILVLGMVVDDAIVILENCYRHLQEGRSLADAAVDGVREVAAPVAISTLTTLAGFLPLVLLPGTMGKFMRIIPITVALVLMASLAEAFWILPSHFVDIVRLKRGHQAGRSRLERWQEAYGRALDKALKHRYITAATCVVVLVASLTLIPLVGVQLFGADEITTVGMMVTMPDGTRIEETERVVAEFERVAMALPEHELEGVMANVGIQQRSDDWVNSPHLGQVWVDITGPKERDRTIQEVAAALRRDTASILGPVTVDFEIIDGGPPPIEPVELLVKGPDIATIEEVSVWLRAKLANMPGVFDVRDDVSLVQPKLDVIVDREAAARHGLDAARIARSVRAAFGGATAATYRDGDEELDVIVRLPERYRRRLSDLSSLRFVSPTGDVVPFSTVAKVVEGESPQTIRRHDRQQAVTVMASVDEDRADIRAVNLQIREEFEKIRATYPSVRLEEGGQFREFAESFQSLAALFGLGLLLNFMLLSGQFKNWSQPFLILAVVPLSFIGAMVGLLISRAPFSIATLYGFVALAGVAVNDSIVLVAFVNQLRVRGLDRWRSLSEAGRLRLRPIILTSVTTIFGLLPMAIGLGGLSKTWQPLATTIAAGLAVATVISLLVVPCLQAILDDGADLVARLRRRSRGDVGSRMPGEPAGQTAQPRVDMPSPSSS